MDPVLDAQEVAYVLSDLMCLNFFPSDDQGRFAVFKVACAMASDVAQLRWLVDRMLQLFNKWPGPADMRAVFCTRFTPADGVWAPRGERGYWCESLERELPSERPALAIASPDMKALPPGSDDKGVDAAFNILNFAVKEKCREFNAKATPEEIAAAPEWLKKLEGYE